MVKVYSWGELRKQKVLSRKQLSQIRKRLMGILKKMYEKGWIDSACLYGSIARKDFKEGSDFDILIVSKPEKREVVTRFARRVIRKATQDMDLPISFFHTTTAEARNANHSLSRSIYNHVLSNLEPQNFVGIHPAKLFKFDKEIAPAIEANHARVRVIDARKEHARQSWQKENNPNAYRSAFLSRIVGQTIHSARHALDSIKPKTIHFGPHSDTNKQIFQAYSAHFQSTHPEAVQALQNVFAARENYRRALSGVLNALKTGDRTKITAAKKRHEKAVEGIEAVVPDRMTVLEANAQILHNWALKKQRKPHNKLLPRRR